MPDIAAAASSIRQRFATEWATEQPSIPLTWDNVEFEPTTVSWVRLSVNPGLREQISMRSQRTWRQWGIIAIQVFTSLDTGPGAGLSLAVVAGRIFEGLSFDGVTCRAYVPVILGSDGAWWQTNVTCEFYCRDQH